MEGKMTLNWKEITRVTVLDEVEKGKIIGNQAVISQALPL
jgi:hypothetical protein